MKNLFFAALLLCLACPVARAQQNDLLPILEISVYNTQNSGDIVKGTLGIVGYALPDGNKIKNNMQGNSLKVSLGKLGIKQGNKITITVQAEGYQKESVPYTVAPGDRLSISIPLKKLAAKQPAEAANPAARPAPGNAAYVAAMAKGDAFAEAQLYNRAIEQYQLALNAKPNDAAARQKLQALRKNNDQPRTYTETVNGVSFTMVYVEGGTFRMGDTFGDGSYDEKPVHEVSLDGYHIAETEVTQALWRAVMGNNPSEFKNCDECPVENVSWDDAHQFIQKLNQRTGKRYRLPTEAEWEYAAKGGKQSRGDKYAGSDNVDEAAWYDSNSGSKTRPVGQKKANELGLYDMSGNVWEWCRDWYGSYSSSPLRNPQGPTSGTDRVCRGGGWSTAPQSARVAYRNYFTPTFRSSSVGFRVAAS